MAEFDKDFYIVFQPKVRDIFYRRRFFVRYSILKNYIGKDNADYAFSRAERALYKRRGKERVLFRKFGIVDFYIK